MQREMEPHSRPSTSHKKGTLRLSLAISLLLATALAEPASNSVTRTVTEHPLTRDINSLVRRLTDLANPFAKRGDFATTISVGMVKLTAFCGIASALWLWRKQNGKEKDGRPAAAGTTDGKVSKGSALISLEPRGSKLTDIIRTSSLMVHR